MVKDPRKTIGVKNFLFLFVNKEFLIFLFFLALSGIFWLLATLNGTYEKELRIPIRLVNIPKSVVITSENTDTLAVTVKDKGFTLLAYMSNKRLPVNINFETYANKITGKGTVSLSELSKQTYLQLYGSSHISSIKPDRLEFYFNYGQSKRVPVKLEGNIVPGKTYYLAGTKLSPDSVLVYAHRTLLDSIHYVSTADVNIVNFEDTVNQTVGLKKLKGVKMVPAQVKISLYPDILTEETVEVPVTAVNMPEGKVLRTFPSRVTVQFTVGVSMFRNVHPDQFRVVADYKDLIAHPADKCSLYLRAYPHNVTKCRILTPQVDYLIEQQ